MDPTLASNPIEHTWVVEISKMLAHQIKIDDEEIPSVSIFHLPESITTKNPEAYEPQQIGLGPIHHFRQGPYKMMEQQKLVVARNQLKENNIEDAKLIVDKVQKLVPIVRSCYDMFLQDDDESLGWVFAIDGLFLLNLFQTYNIGIGEKEEYLVRLEKKAGVYKQVYEQKKYNRDLLSEIQKKKQNRPIITTNWREIIQVYKKTVSVLETFTQTKIFIPSAFELHDKAEFMFKGLKKHQGIRNIYNKDNKIYLPCVTLNNDSEVILRNLVAYETLITTDELFPLTEYMYLMCSLIVNVDDVKYLRGQKVIDGETGDVQVAKLFIEMSNSVQHIATKQNSELQKMIDEVNVVNNNRLGMKMYLSLKKLAGWLLVGLKAIGKFVEDCWKIVAFMISVVAVFMLTYQAYCDVYGCDKKSVTFLPYTSS